MYFMAEGIYFSEVTVVKFGGSSLGTVEKLKKATKLVADKCRTGEKLVVVTSAMGKTTDDLLKIINGSALKQNHEVDEILAMGERTSIRVFKALLNSEGVESDLLDIEHDEWPIITNNKHGDADILLEISEDRIKKTIISRLRKVDALIIPGFVGKSEEGRITTIGRGGSDATALVIAGALNAKEAILVSDIDGIMSADPKLIAKPHRIQEIDVDKLTGIADSGRKFIKKKALAYKKKNVPLKLINANSESLDTEGTRIVGAMTDISVELEEQNSISSVTIVGQNLSTNPRLLAQFLTVFHNNDVSLQGMSANHNSIVFYGSQEGIAKSYEKLHELVVENKESIAISRRDELGAVLLNGIGLQETPGSMSRAASILQKNGINIYGQYTVMSEIFFIVSFEDVDKSLELIKNELINGGKDHGKN
jgi:aspartate kinase